MSWKTEQIATADMGTQMPMIRNYAYIPRSPHVLPNVCVLISALTNCPVSHDDVVVVVVVLVVLGVTTSRSRDTPLRD